MRERWATPMPRSGQGHQCRERILVDGVAPRDRELFTEQVADTGLAERHVALGDAEAADGHERGGVASVLGALHDELGVPAAMLRLDAQTGEVALLEAAHEP